MNSLTNMNAEKIRDQILELSKEYSRLVHCNGMPLSQNETENIGYETNNSEFFPGISSIDYAARVFDEKEVAAAINTTLDFWLTLGQEGEAMEREFAQFLGIRKSLLVNSGSSANLVALSTLTSPKAPGRRIMKGDEVITCAAGFPTTVSPIIQNGLVSVFIDNDPLTGNLDVTQLEQAFI